MCLSTTLSGVEFLDTNVPSTTQCIQHTLLNIMIHYFVHISLPKHLLLSQINTVHTCPPYFFKIQLITLEFIYFFTFSTYLLVKTFNFH